jgi:hypothetical protein
MTRNRWAHLGRVEMIACGKGLVSDRLECFGCNVTHAANPIDGRLSVHTASGRALEVFVSRQRVGGYAFWTKRRLQPAPNRYAALVLLSDAPEPDLYLVPSTDWLHAEAPLTDRDYEGRKSEPEYGIDISAAAVSQLARYAWSGSTANSYFA